LRPPPGEPPIVSHIIRTDEVYLVPRSSGELVVGATVEEKGFDTSLTAGAVRGLLEAAEEIVPGVRDMEVVETGVGLRPGSRDNAPLLGIVEEGLIAATGHFRNGILLTPITALSITQLVTTGKTPGLIAPFSPLRFSTVVA
jgi:glycine oxidase